MITKNDIVICCIVKLENPYLVEWITYHLNLGFDKVMIYDDNDLPEERVTNLPEIIDWMKQGIVHVENSFGIQAPQLKMYEKFYHNNKFSWVCFLDVDEFIILHDCKTIKEFVAKEEFKNADTISFNWKFFGDNEKLYISNEPVLERFTEEPKVPQPEKEILCKILARPNIPGVIFADPHQLFSKSYQVKAYHCNGTLLAAPHHTQPIDYSKAQINHYFTKSLEEFVMNKIAKGSPCFKDNTFRSLNFYWTVNTKTPEKETLMIKFKKEAEERNNIKLSFTEGVGK